MYMCVYKVASFTFSLCVCRRAHAPPARLLNTEALSLLDPFPNLNPVLQMKDWLHPLPDPNVSPSTSHAAWAPAPCLANRYCTPPGSRAAGAAAGDRAVAWVTCEVVAAAIMNVVDQ